MYQSDYNSSPYATFGGSLSRQQSLARQGSLRNSTGSYGNGYNHDGPSAYGAPNRNILDNYGSFAQRPGSGRGGPASGNMGLGGRISNSGSGTALYSSSSGGASVLPGASSRPAVSGGWASATGGGKEPLSQRLAQVKAVYNAARLNRSLGNMLQGGGTANRPEVRAAAAAAAAAAASPGRGGGRTATPTRQGGQRPVGFTCYLCGQQYGSQSLMVHIPQCQKKWVMVESSKPRLEQRPLPPMPPELEAGVLPSSPGEVEAFNSRMYAYWDKVSLVACPICARTFRPDAFERHAKVCTPNNPGGPLGPNKHATARPPSARPPGMGGGGGAAGRPASAARPVSAGRGYGTGGGGGGYGGGGGGGGSPSPSRVPARQGGQRPVGFTCYLCGQQYGSQSLMVHIPQCQKKWVMVEASKPRREQRPLPPMPPELEAGVLPSSPGEVEAFNSRMYAYWDKVSLVACPICARTFRPDAFERHAKVCTPDNPGGPLGPNKHATARPPSARPPGMGGGGSPARPASASRAAGGGGGGGGTPPRREGERPRAYVCYLCGQQFGSQSLTIHIPQCYEKWLKVEATKPAKERRPPPPPPPELDQPLPTRPHEIDEFNSKMFGYYNGVSLMPCPNCGRTFRPEALRAHQKACTPDKPMARPGAPLAGGGGGAAAGGGGGGGGGGPSEYDDGSGGELEMCANCGRKMRPDALVKHQRMCTAAKPMKPLRAAGGGQAGAAAGAAPAPTPARGPAGRGGFGGGGGGGGGAGGRPPSGQGHAYGGDGGGGGEQQEEDDAGPEPPKVSYNLPPGAGADGGDGDEERVQCGTCGRRFLPEAYDKHVRVCAKVFAGKRKVFNSAAKRVAGTEAASYFNPRAAAGARASPAPPAGPPPSTGGRPRAAGGARGGPGGAAAGGAAGGGGVPKWKAQSNALRQAMQQMRQVGAALARGEDIRNIPHVPSAPDPSLVQCPTCGRRFNAQAAERHIPRCSSIVNKPKFLKAGTGGAGKGAPDSKPLPRW
ncbi:hypothetical protein Agub_g999 [Astrephomene gubernaculifera]|uniref:C2HC/C3H-type domain-containing protein n=1 Tax=Astrephomene gubernaculifera TaxID=47775 RepID=A0AAD3DEQ4_9CHLO|nr:hypothetical protein Agub_g999 [Astrephomene gubernaculifera]